MFKILLKSGINTVSHRSSRVKDLYAFKNTIVKTHSSDGCFCLICSTWKKKPGEKNKEKTWVNDYPVI